MDEKVLLVHQMSLKHLLEAPMFTSDAGQHHI